MGNKMKQFVNFMGEVVDLDSETTYLECNLSKNWADLHLDCIKELGYALVYMDYLNKDCGFDEQRKRVEILLEELCSNDQEKRGDHKYWLEFLYRIQDEIENMC